MWQRSNWLNEIGQLLGKWKYDRNARVLLFLFLAILLFLLLLSHVVPKTYDLELGKISPTDVISPKMFPDEKATNAAKLKAANAVEDQFVQNNQITQQQLNQSDKIFQTAENILSDTQFTVEQKVTILKRGIPYDLSEEAYYKFIRIPIDDLPNMKATARRIIQDIMGQGVRDADLADARNKVNSLLVSTDLQKDEREVVMEIARSIITPNTFVDQVKTKQLREMEMDRVPPIYVNKNDVLVGEGSLITSDIYERLKLAGVLRQHVSYLPHFGLLVLVSLFLFTLYLFIQQSNLPVKYNNAHLLMLIVVYALDVFSMKIISIGQDLNYHLIGYMAPVAFGTLIIAILLDYRIALVSSVFLSVTASIIFNVESNTVFDYRFGFVALISSLVSTFAISQANRQRSEILKVGFIISAICVLGVGAIQLLSNVTSIPLITQSVSYGFVNGLLTAVLTIGLLPFFEASFGILSSVKLIELSNPNHPLLRKLLTEAPGTYHHSVMVGNLSEAAAEAIGADGLLCRVGSYYHDLGKTKRPSFFIENQMKMDNPHDRLDPSLSRTIILSHPRDGVELLKEYRLPRPIRDIAEQHHGTTLLKYFYHKALKIAPEGKVILEQDYRYPGPKAQTKEAAIVGIADCVEAAVRSITNPTPEQIVSMVRHIIKDRLDDGQFNECDLTFRELEEIAESIGETLMGIFHSRIEYPSEEELKGVRHA